MPHPASRLLDQRTGLDVQVDLDARQPVGQLMEGDDAGVRDALGDLPLDPVVGSLLDDLGLELLRDAPDLRLERDVGLVLLRHALQPVHELRPVFELCPLVVGGLDGYRHVNSLLHWQPATLAHAREPVRIASPAASPAWSTVFPTTSFIPAPAFLTGAAPPCKPLRTSFPAPFTASGAIAASPAPAATPLKPES